MTVGERIKKLREEHNNTQEELATFLKTTKQTIYKYENNIITNIPSDRIESIAFFLHTTPSFLMGWEDGQENNRPLNSDFSELQGVYLSLAKEAQDNMIEPDDIRKVLQIINDVRAQERSREK